MKSMFPLRARWVAWLLAALLTVVSGSAFSQSPSPEESRGTAFTQSGTNECRETVPGGKLLVIAYAIVIVVLGGYVVFIARKASSVSSDLENLKLDLEARRDNNTENAT